MDCVNGQLSARFYVWVILLPCYPHLSSEDLWSLEEVVKGGWNVYIVFHGIAEFAEWFVLEVGFELISCSIPVVDSVPESMLGISVVAQRYEDT